MESFVKNSFEFLKVFVPVFLFFAAVGAVAGYQKGGGGIIF